MLAEILQAFIDEESLPETYAADAAQWFLPLLPLLEALREHKRTTEDAPVLLGINGAQGTGKSTLAALLCKLLNNAGHSVANLSIDDFYLSHATRQQLARDVHPLFASRGVPGTHDTALLRDILAALQKAGESDAVKLPRFDKANDDCCPESTWPELEGSVDFIILEGWFIGLEPQSEGDLIDAINELERNEDPQGAWRQRVNCALAGAYQEVFASLDYLIMLRAPSFDQVYEWRQVQEDKLRGRSHHAASGLMDSVALGRFIQHFERLTRHSLATVPERADRVFALDAEHRVAHCELPGANS